jgi:hypothetical protein
VPALPGLVFKLRNKSLYSFLECFTKISSQFVFPVICIKIKSVITEQIVTITPVIPLKKNENEKTIKYINCVIGAYINVMILGANSLRYVIVSIKETIDDSAKVT